MARLIQVFIGHHAILSIEIRRLKCHHSETKYLYLMISRVVLEANTGFIMSLMGSRQYNLKKIFTCKINMLSYILQQEHKNCLLQMSAL